MMLFRYLLFPWLLSVGYACLTVLAVILLGNWLHLVGNIPAMIEGAVAWFCAMGLGWGTVWLLVYRKE